MTTLGKAITSQFYVNPESGYQEIKAAWKEQKTHTFGEHIAYAALLGRDWRKGVSILTNANKLANGGYYNSGLYRAGCYISIPSYLKPFVKADAEKAINARIMSANSGLPAEAYKEVV